MSFASDRSPSTPIDAVAAKLAQFGHLLSAVLLQDMRGRFGASYLGYLIAIGWPLSHLAILTGLYYVKTQIAPIGDSTTQFVATGVVPYILCLYTARNLARSIDQNRQLLNIPKLKPFHLILGRCILEMLSGMVILAIYIFVLFLFDVDIMPTDLPQAEKAVGAAIFLGVGLGFFNVTMCAVFGFYFSFLFTLSMVSLYILSGVYIPASSMPEKLMMYNQYNPMLNLVEWLRSAYYASYDGETIKKTLVLTVAGVCLGLGLVGERFLRGKFLS